MWDFGHRFWPQSLENDEATKHCFTPFSGVVPKFCGFSLNPDWAWLPLFVQIEPGCRGLHSDTFRA